MKYLGSAVTLDICLAEITTVVTTRAAELDTHRAKSAWHLVSLWQYSFLRIKARSVERIGHNFVD
jgi:hypothetical protein